MDEVLDSSGGKFLGQLASISVHPEPAMGCRWIRKGMATEAQTEAMHHSIPQRNRMAMPSHRMGTFWVWACPSCLWGLGQHLV